MVYWGSKEKMVLSFIDFDFVIQNLKRQKKIFGFDFGKVCSADRNKIFVVISKFKTLWIYFVFCI